MSAEGVYISSPSDEQQLLTMYLNQYNQTNAHIDTLVNMLDEIKRNIINIIHPRRRGISSHTLRDNNRHYNNNNRHYNNNNRHYNNSNRHYNNSNRHYNNSNRHYNNSNRYNNNSNRYNNNSNRQNNSIFYDYNNPINPTIYNENMTNLFQNFLNTSQLVCPTNEQIQNASRIIRYGNIENPLSQSCPISLEEFQENNMIRQLLHCGHLFHQTQFDEWFQNNVRCPVCRYDIRNYTSLSTQNTSLPNEEISNNTETNSNTLNQIEHVTFDVSNEQFTDIFFNTLVRSIFQSNLDSNTHNPLRDNNNNNSNPLRDNRIIDPSNNIL